MLLRLICKFPQYSVYSSLNKRQDYQKAKFQNTVNNFKKHTKFYGIRCVRIASVLFVIKMNRENPI